MTESLKKTYVYTTSLAWLFLIQDICAQEVIPRREKDFVPSALFLSADAVSLFRNVFYDQSRYDFRAKVDFDRYFLAFDFGLLDADLSGAGDSLATNFHYNSTGYYYRLGPQINFLPYNPTRSNLYLGLMYARSYFTDQINYNYPSDSWGDAQLALENKRIRASWFEANLGINARITGPLFIGYVLRFKLAKNSTGSALLDPYEIPGFGRAKRNGSFGFSYYIAYRFGFRNKPVPIRPPKPKRLEKKPEEDEAVGGGRR